MDLSPSIQRCKKRPVRRVPIIQRSTAMLYLDVLDTKLRGKGRKMNGMVSLIVTALFGSVESFARSSFHVDGSE